MGFIDGPVLSNEGNMKEHDMEDIYEDEFESQDEDEEIKLDQPSKKHIYKAEGLLEKLEDVSWPKDSDWIHKLAINFDQEQEVDVNDDLARELAFYTQALEGTRQAFEKLQSMGLPFLRPPDYYAEMVKTDSHMEKVRGRLLVEKKRLEEAEERRKAREAKRIAKEVQAQKLKERTKQKKDQIESVKKWRKQRKQSGYAGGKDDAELGLDFEDGKSFERSKKKRPGVAPGDRSGGRAKQGWKKGMDRKKTDREFKNSKFGFGGRKGLKKQNTAQTTNDFRDFNKSGSSKGNKKRKR
ncbi:hypothetical protein ACLOJK_015559 [Asimina triloba]